jgi:hypothetical protein
MGKYVTVVNSNTKNGKSSGYHREKYGLAEKKIATVRVQNCCKKSRI